MINLSFVIGGALRKVSIDGKKITMASQETGFMPTLLDLEKIKNSEASKQMTLEQKELIEIIGMLDTEVEMAEDIIADFQRSGWRLVKRE